MVDHFNTYLYQKRGFYYFSRRVPKELHYCHAKPKRKTISASLRAKVFERDNWRCKDCGKSASDDVTLHVHHINPVSHGGVNDLDNLVINCSDCNLGKSDKILR